MRTYKYYTPLIFQKIGYVVFFLLYKIFVRIEVRGKEHITGLNKPIILAMNHTSELDVTTLPLLFPFFSKFFPIYCVMMPIEKFKTFGWRSYLYGSGFLTMLGGYSTFSGHKDYSIALEDHVALLKNGHTICIFPEGKRTRDGLLNPAHGGLGFLVYTTSATVVPVALDTFFNISPWDFFTRKRKVIITILKPMLASDIISVKNPQVSDFQQASQKVMDKIAEILH